MSPSRTRGRPRQFDRDTALDAAMHTFWQSGFSATSLDDLTAAMGLNRPSIYASFGNKQQLYMAAVKRYSDTLGQRYLTALSSTGSLAADLSAFFRSALDTMTGELGPGCPVACTLPAETENAPEIKAALAAFLVEADRAVCERIRAAQVAGELAPEADARTIAQLVVNTMFSISIRARAGTSRRELNRMIRAFVAMIVASSPAE